MAKVYGDRWRVIRSLSEGGQAQLFEVADARGVVIGACALKRIRNPLRRDRFDNEVEALRRLDHPGIVKLIDHSTDPAGPAYLVMPLAVGGDLSKRVQAFKDNLDGTVSVALSLAAALEAAHAGRIVHRDVKPANILFPGPGNEVWLADFGICYLPEAVRVTENGEIVGPRSFLAPELEAGIVAEATPAADVYSLGKVLYYMISGGVVLPREMIDEDRYARILERGGRFSLFGLLLRRMICRLDDRLETMAAVSKELGRIADWDRYSIDPPISPLTRSRIESLQRDAVTGKRDHVSEMDAERRGREDAAAIGRQMAGFLQGELEKFAIDLAVDGEISAEVGNIPKGELGHLEVKDLHSTLGVQVVMGGLSSRVSASHVLQLHLCRRQRTMVRINIGATVPPRAPPEDVVFTVVPIYRRLGNGDRPRVEKGHYLLPGNRLHPMFDPPRPGVAPAPTPPIQVMLLEVPSGTWPGSADRLREIATSACDHFVEVLTRNKDSHWVV